MNDRFRLSSTLGRKLEQLGLSPGAVLRQARLPVRLFDESKAWVTTEELFALYSAIHELSIEPDMGLKLGSDERIERHDPIAIAALCARTFRDSLSALCVPKNSELWNAGMNAQFNSCGCSRKRKNRPL